MKKSAEDAAKHGKAHGAWWLEAFNQMNPSASPSAEPSSSGEDARKRHDAGADDRKGGGVSMLAAMGGSFGGTDRYIVWRRQWVDDSDVYVDVNVDVDVDVDMDDFKGPAQT